MIIDKSGYISANHSNYNYTMKFLFICGREIDYTRNQVLLRAFSKIGEVETIAEIRLGQILRLSGRFE